jgi:methionyl-tRNA formyltransferase
MPRVVFFGTPQFAIPTLNALNEEGFTIPVIVTQPDSNSGRGLKLQESPVKAWALDKGIPVLQPAKIKASLEDFLRTLDKFQPLEAAVVVAFGQILPAALLQYFKGLCINVHASLLPKYRGAAPIQHAILNGDSESGVTIMQMEAGLDSGPIYVKEKFTITKECTGGELYEGLSVLGGKLCASNLSAILSKKILPVPQEGEVSYARKILSVDYRIDWRLPHSTVLNKIRAFLPRPGSVTTLNGKRVKILSAKPYVTSPTYSLPPGSLHEVTLEGEKPSLLVGTGDGTLRICILQSEGGKALPYHEWRNGNYCKGLRFI